MARPNRLNNIQVDEILKLFDAGSNATQIQTHLKTKHQIDMSVKGICRYLKRLKDSRKTATDLAYKNAAAASAVRDIDIIDKKIMQLDKLSDELLLNKEYKFARDFQETLLKFVSKKIELNGPGELIDETKDLLDSLINKTKDK